MPSFEQSERIGGATLLGVPIFDFFVWALDNYSRIELLVKLHGLLPHFLTSPVTIFLCLCGVLGLLYRSERTYLQRVATNSVSRIVDTSGAEIATITNPNWALPVGFVFVLALVAAPVVAIGYSLAYEGSSPKKPRFLPPPYIAYAKTPKPNVTKRLHAPALHIEQQSTGSDSPNQAMIGSPGSVQAGRDVNITSDKRIIQSIALRVYIETDTQPSKPTGPSDADTSAGLQSAVALFTASERIRFVSDWLVKDRQASETRRRLSFLYNPETQEQILGKEISFLSSISIFAVNYKDLATNLKFAFSTNTVLHADVIVNGVPVAVIDAREAQPGALAGGQANLNVAEAFGNAPAVYSRVVAR